jgi:hypothetical protein
VSHQRRLRRLTLIIAGAILAAVASTQVGPAFATGTPSTGTSPSPSPTKPSPSPTKPSPSPTKPSPSPTKPPNKPPVCTGVTVSPDTLWPPNHKFTVVTLVGATDPDGDQTTLTVTGVTQDEPLDGLGDGDTAPDAARVTGRSDQVQLRAERSGTGDGRVYRITFTVSDGKDRCTGTVYVAVPHDQSGDPAVDTTTVVVNSFG